LLLGVEGCDGDRVVVDVECGIGGFVVDGRAVARFCNRVEVVWEGRGRGWWVWPADEPLACAVVGGHEVNRHLCYFLGGLRLEDQFFGENEGGGRTACVVVVHLVWMRERVDICLF
jgi:hypothetical protein